MVCLCVGHDFSFSETQSVFCDPQELSARNLAFFSKDGNLAAKSF